MLRFATLVFLPLITIYSCNTTTQNQNSATGTPAPPQQTKSPDKQNDELRKRLEQIASLAKGRVGVAAEILETDESVSINLHEHFPMQSVYKLPIGMAVLAQVDRGKLRLEQVVSVEKGDLVGPGLRSPIRDRNPNGTKLSLEELLRFAVSESDGTASDVLLKLIGVDVAGKYLNDLGINEIIVANSEKEISQDWETQYRNWASPYGALQLLRCLHERRGLSEQRQRLLYKFMTETPTGPNRLKGLLPKTAVVAHKTGTSGSSKDITAATNDIGLITLPNGQHLAIAVFVSDSPANLETRERVIAEISKAVWDKYSHE